MKLTAVQTGIAGEYLVAAELTRRGYIASLTLRNTRGIDILASNFDATRSVGIQVKATQNRKAVWILNKKAESDIADNLFYIFVCLPEGEAPTYYVVPRRVVGRYVREDHEAWLEKGVRDGSPHRDTDIRQFRDPDGVYKGAWHTLGLQGT